MTRSGWVISQGASRLAATAVAVFLGAGSAGAGNADVRYAISLAGFSIGKASLSAEFNGTSYTLSVSSALTGLAGAISGGRGSATARGTIGGNGVLTSGFTLQASNGKDSRVVRIGAASGSVRSVSIEPPFEVQEGENRIPLRDSHKVGVADPASALLMPVRGSDPLDKTNCERRLSIFDGTQRFDVVLSFSGVKQLKGDGGYSGAVLVCSARYVPVAGHRPDRRVTKFMAENREMSAWLVPVNGGKALIPYRISVKTLIGTTVIEAESFNPG